MVKLQDLTWQLKVAYCRQKRAPCYPNSITIQCIQKVLRRISSMFDGNISLLVFNQYKDQLSPLLILTQEQEGPEMMGKAIKIKLKLIYLIWHRMKNRTWCKIKNLTLHHKTISRSHCHVHQIASIWQSRINSNRSRILRFQIMLIKQIAKSIKQAISRLLKLHFKIVKTLILYWAVK